MDLYYHWKFREGKIFPLPFYAPVFHTSAVTQCLNSFADGSLLLRIRAYRPDSLMIVICCAPEGVSILDIPRSSWKTFSLAAFVGFAYPKAVATSLPTNHGSPEISTVLTVPNCGWVNTVGASVDVDASGRWGGHFSPSSIFWSCLLKDCSFVTHPHSSRRKNAYSIRPPGEMSMFPIHRCWWMRNYQLSHIKKVYKILLTLFEYILQKSISVSGWTLSQLCQKNNSSGCILNQTYYFTCNNTFI